MSACRRLLMRPKGCVMHNLPNPNCKAFSVQSKNTGTFMPHRS